MKSSAKCIHPHSTKCIWKCRLGNGGNFVSASMFKGMVFIFQQLRNHPTVHSQYIAVTFIQIIDERTDWSFDTRSFAFGAVNRVILLRDLSEVCSICIHLTLNCTEPQCWTWILLKCILHCHAICYWYQMPCLLNFAQDRDANKLRQYLSWWWHFAYPVHSRPQGKYLLIEIQWDKLTGSQMFFF